MATLWWIINKAVVNLVVLLIVSHTPHLVNGLQCMSNENKPVDWFIAYKLPLLKHEARNSFMYLDAQNQNWQLVPRTLDQPQQAIYNTLDQIYSPKPSQGVSVDSMMYAMYTDQTPSGHVSTSNGHTKGVLGFDQAAGFWLVHSLPRFPPPRTSGYWLPVSSQEYAQSFMCISMATDYLNEIGKQFQYNWPHFYDKNLPVTFAKEYPAMAAALRGDRVRESPWTRETTLRSLGGVQFTSFAKFRCWNHDLYADWLAPRFRDSLYVETWQKRNPMCSNCTGIYNVLNVKTLRFSGVEFKETQDHAKWAITANLSWVCVGDINREESQKKRGGGTVCFQNKQVWSSFRDVISDKYDCNDHEGCVPP